MENNFLSNSKFQIKNSFAIPFSDSCIFLEQFKINSSIKNIFLYLWEHELQETLEVSLNFYCTGIEFENIYIHFTKLLF